MELFKFYLGKVPESKKPKLPNQVTPDRAITDYLREMGNQSTVFFFKKMHLRIRTNSKVK